VAWFLRNDPVRLSVQLENNMHLAADVVITTGGCSVGENDLVKQLITDVGATLGFGRVSMKPGYVADVHGSGLITWLTHFQIKLWWNRRIMCIYTWSLRFLAWPKLTRVGYFRCKPVIRLLPCMVKLRSGLRSIFFAVVIHAKPMVFVANFYEHPSKAYCQRSLATFAVESDAFTGSVNKQ